MDATLNLDSTVSSWDKDIPFPSNGGSIATETIPHEDSNWPKAIDALLYVYSQALRGQEFEVTGLAVRTALNRVLRWRKDYPWLPPTYVAIAPDGGLIVERRDRDDTNRLLVLELTFNNDGSIESASFIDGRLIEMKTNSGDY